MSGIAADFCVALSACSWPDPFTSGAESSVLGFVLQLLQESPCAGMRQWEEERSCFSPSPLHAPFSVWLPGELPHLGRDVPPGLVADLRRPLSGFAAEGNFHCVISIRVEAVMEKTLP